MPEPPPLRKQLIGLESIRRALDAREPVRIVLALSKGLSLESQKLVEYAIKTGAHVVRTTENDLRRMSAHEESIELLAMVGPNPTMPLSDLLAQPGTSWLLSRSSYASNAGFAIRAAEVSGADGIIIDSNFSKEQRRQALRVSMGAHRFLPVYWETSTEVIALARKCGKQIFALEDVGEKKPWEVDLTLPALLIVGNERTGIEASILAQCDSVLRLPMPGFVPSYNVQAVVSAVATERLRQLGTTH